VGGGKEERGREGTVKETGPPPPIPKSQLRLCQYVWDLIPKNGANSPKASEMRFKSNDKTGGTILAGSDSRVTTTLASFFKQLLGAKYRPNSVVGIQSRRQSSKARTRAYIRINCALLDQLSTSR